MTYYGLAFNADDLPGNDYVNFLLLGAAEIPGLIVCIPLMEYLGRRVALVSLMGTGGVSCILCACIPAGYPMLIVSLALFGKMAISGAFAVIYNYSAELYPTVVRQASTGLSSMCGRVGSILAPQVHLLGKLVNPWLPMLIYGLVAVIAAAMDVLLPETKNHPMPDTIAEAVEFCERNSVMPCLKKLAAVSSHHNHTSQAKPTSVETQI